MSATQVSSEEEEEYGLKASTSSTTQLHNHQQPQHSTKNNQVSIPPRPSPPPPFCFTPVSRVVTKESLREFETSTTRFEFLPVAQRQVDINFGSVGIDDDDEHSLQSSLFEFSLLDPDGRDCDGELLALPLPLTSSSSSSIDVVDAEHFLTGPPTLHNLDTYAALLSFDSSSIFHEDSDSTTASSSLAAVSTAAAIVASQQQQQLLQLPVNEVGDEGSVPSLVAVYPDCTTHQPSAPIIHSNSVKLKSKRTTARGGGAASRKANSVISRSNSTTTTRGTKIAFVNNQVTHEQTLQGYNSIMEQEPDSTVLSPPLPRTTASAQASMTRYAPPPTVASSQGGDMVVDPTTTLSTLQYHHAHHNHAPSVPPLGSLNHHHPAVNIPPQGGTIITRPRLSNMGDHHHHQPVRVGGVIGGNVPSPRSTSSSPSENNQPHHQGTSLSKNMVVNNNNLHPTTTAAAAAAENTGRWTAEEHRLFLQGLEQHGKGWKKIATLIQSRTVVQIRTHAQKYFQKLTKAHQAGEGGVLLVGGGGGVSGTVGGGVGTQMISAGTAEGDGTVGIAIPLGPDGQPVVSMRTTSHATASASSSSGNNGMGSDPSSTWAGTGGEGGATAGAMHGSGRSRRRASHASGGGTKRRVIGNVVRSAVREGRNVKRQKIAELKRKVGGGGDTPVLDVAPSSDPAAVAAAGGGKEDHRVVPNPIPSVSKILVPYMPPPPPPGVPLAAPGRAGGHGRQQLVHTATHGTLPMAALEDAVFRLLTPATGAPPPPGSQQQQSHLKNNAAVIDPLARQSNPNHQANVPLTHTKYPPLSGGGPSGYPQGILNYSPTGIADMALLPSWVDAKNPPSWYNDGSDIDTLLEDADCLNWLSDTGDLDETYPPAMAEPAAVVSSSSTAANSIGAVSGQTIAITSTTIQEPAGGVFHPSTDSLSFLVDPPEYHHVVEDVNQLPSFLDEPLPSPAGAADATYASATEAVEATTSAPITSSSFASTTIHITEHQLDSVGDSVTNLVGFPDLDMGDEQAFVSALLENSGPSIMSFPKLNSDLHTYDTPTSQRNLAMNGGTTEEVPETKVDEYA